MQNNDMRQEILDRVDAATKIMNSDSKKHDFTLDKNGFHGEFTFKYPSLMDKMRIGTTRAKFLSGLSSDMVDVLTDNIAFMSATLMVVCIKAPKWFNLEDMDDYEVLESVYEGYKKWADTFRRDNNEGRDEGDSRATSDEKIVEGDETL